MRDFSPQQQPPPRRANSMTARSYQVVHHPPAPVRRAASRANSLSSGAPRTNSLTETHTVVDRDQRGRTLSITTTTVRHLGSYEITSTKRVPVEDPSAQIYIPRHDSLHSVESDLAGIVELPESTLAEVAEEDYSNAFADFSEASRVRGSPRESRSPLTHTSATLRRSSLRPQRSHQDLARSRSDRRGANPPQQPRARPAPPPAAAVASTVHRVDETRTRAARAVSPDLAPSTASVASSASTTVVETTKSVPVEFESPAETVSSQPVDLNAPPVVKAVESSATLESTESVGGAGETSSATETHQVSEGFHTVVAPLSVVSSTAPALDADTPLDTTHPVVGSDAPSAIHTAASDLSSSQSTSPIETREPPSLPSSLPPPLTTDGLLPSRSIGSEADSDTVELTDYENDVRTREPRDGSGSQAAFEVKSHIRQGSAFSSQSSANSVPLAPPPAPAPAPATPTTPSAMRQGRRPSDQKARVSFCDTEDEKAAPAAAPAPPASVAASAASAASAANRVSISRAPRPASGRTHSLRRTTPDPAPVRLSDEDASRLKSRALALLGQQQQQEDSASEYESEAVTELKSGPRLKKKGSKQSMRSQTSAQASPARASVVSTGSGASTFASAPSGTHHYRALVDDAASDKSESSFKREQSFRPERGMTYSLRDNTRSRSQSVSDRFSLRSTRAEGDRLSERASLAAAAPPSPSTRTRSQSISSRAFGSDDKPFKSRFADSDSDTELPSTAAPAGGAKRGKLTLAKVFSPNTDVRTLIGEQPRAAPPPPVDTGSPRKKKGNFFKRLLKPKKKETA